MNKETLLAGLGRFVPDARAVERLQRLSGGASKETWSLDLALADGTSLPLIVRRALPPAGGLGSSGTGLAGEAALIRLAHSAGAPVPMLLGRFAPDEGSDPELGEALVMERVDGETLPRRILRDARFDAVRPRLATECGTILARLHAIAFDTLPPLRRAPPRDELAHYEAQVRTQRVPRPVVELALRWLHDHLPPDTPLTLVHGDFRHGNLLIGEDRIRAVLDWELAHAGDPMEDLGWLCVASWRFGALSMPVGGFGTREQLFEAYEAAGGVRVDPRRVHWWETMGTLKWCVMCGHMLAAFRDGADRSVERAAIGRRASEAELDLLRLLLPRSETR